MTPAAALGWFFAIAAGASLLGLCAIAARDVPRIGASAALIVTLAALAAAIPH